MKLASEIRRGNRVIVLISLLLCALPVWAALTGDVQGTVFDPNGLVISDATVTIKNIATGGSRTLKTDSNGEFAALQLEIGQYEVKVEKQNFRSFSQNVDVRSGDVTRLNVTMQVGQAAETITVEDVQGPALDVATAQISISIDEKTVKGLPNIGRDPLNLASLSPGVIPVSTNNPFLGSGSFNSNGQRGRANNITVDNITSTDISTTGSAGLGSLSLDAIQEFKLITNNFSAEFGRNSGSQVQILTKSGTNEYHGTAYWFHRNSALNARDFFDTTGKATPFIRNLWGFTAGGPIIKNHTFAFGHYEGLRIRGAGDTRLATVLKPSDATAITDPTSRAVFAAVGSPTDPSGKLSNSASNATNAFSWSLRIDESFRGGKDVITGRYSHQQSTATAPSLTFIGTNLANYGAGSVNGPRNFSFGHTHIFGPAVINQFRFAFGRTSPQFQPATTLKPPYAPPIAVSGFDVFGVSRILPQGRVQNIFQYSDSLSWALGRHSWKFGADVFRYQANSFFDADFRGRVDFGSLADFQAGTPNRFRENFGNSVRGNRSTDFFFFVQDDFRVTNSLTLNLGVRAESSGGVSEVHGLLSNLDRKRFDPMGSLGTGALGTVVLGGTAFNRNLNWAPRVGFAWNPHNEKFVLRGGYGWAYDYIFLNPITNLRFSAPFIPSIDFRGPFTGANSWANLVAGTAAVQASANASVGKFPATQANFGGLSPVNQNLKNPKATQWSLGAQYQVRQDLVLKASYVGVKGDYLLVSLPINLVRPNITPAPATSEADELARIGLGATPPSGTFRNVFNGESGSATTGSNRVDPRFNGVTSVESAGSSIYHGLELEALKRFKQGYSFQASYTWSHSLDNASDVLGVLVNDSAAIQDPRNLKENRGNSQFDVRQRFVLSHLWEIPWTKRFSGVSRKILDGWAFTGIFQIQSGFPATIFANSRYGITDFLLVGESNVRANGSLASFKPAVLGSAAAALIPSPCARGVRTSTTGPNSVCTNTSNFPLSQPLIGNPGTLGRNTLRLDRFNQFDWAILKSTSITEQQRLEFRFEMFNVFNHPAFAGFRNLLDSTTFGTYTTTSNDTRRIQFALKYVF